jgi:hypothetical protein
LRRKKRIISLATMEVVRIVVLKTSLMIWEYESDFSETKGLMVEAFGVEKLLFFKT